MRRIVFISKSLLLLTIILLISSCSNSEVIEDSEYDVSIMKKVAYDTLGEEEQKTIIKSLDDYLIVINDGGDMISFEYNMDALNVDKVWRYAICEEVLINNLEMVLWINEDIKNEIETYNKDRIALRIEMQTTNLLVGPVVIYVDPIEEKAIGYGLRF